MNIKPRIGIWGFYEPNNFGDDLMGWMLANELSKIGHIYIYRLNSDVANSANAISVNSLSAIVENSDIVVLGGGNLLAEEETWPDKERWNKEIGMLVEELYLHQTPLFIVSVGGNGTPLEPDRLMKGVRSLLEYPNLVFTSVRLPSDCKTVERISNSPVRFYKDMLLDVQRQFKTHRVKQYKIGIHAPNIHFIAKATKFLELINQISPLRLKIVYISCHPRGSEYTYEYMPLNPARYSELLYFEDISQFTKVLSELRLVVSFKLHVGLVSYAFGSNWINIGSHPKIAAQTRLLDKKVFTMPSTSRSQDGWMLKLNCFFWASKVYLLAVASALSFRIPNNRKEKVDDSAYNPENHIRILCNAITDM